MSTAPSQFRLVRPGLTKTPNTLSIMSVEKPGWYLRHYGYRLFLEPIDNPRNRHIFDKDATFTERVDVFNKGSTSFQSVNYPKYFISRVNNRDLYIQRPSTGVLKDSASFTVNASKYVFCCLITWCVITLGHTCKMLLLEKCETVLIADYDLLGLIIVN